MDNKQYKKFKDSRIDIWVYINKKGDVEEYPVGGFPVELFIINENLPAAIYTTEKAHPNSYYFGVNKNFYKDVCATLKNTAIVGEYYVADHFGWNITGGSFFYTTSTIFFSFTFGLRLTSISSSKLNIFQSGSHVYQNLTWLERESSDMFDIVYSGLRDTRKLLLDYTTDRGVMVKTSKVVQHSSYSILKRGVVYNTY